MLLDARYNVPLFCYIDGQFVELVGAFYVLAGLDFGNPEFHFLKVFKGDIFHFSAPYSI